MASKEKNNSGGPAVERREPQNDHDKLQQVWYVLIGANGHGLVSAVERIEKKLDEHLQWAAAFVPTLWTKKEHEQFVEIAQEAKESSVVRDLERQRHEDNKRLQRWAIFATVLIVAWPVAVDIVRSLLVTANK